jgi:two-component system response regulator NreC
MLLDLVLEYLSKDPDFNIINSASCGDKCLELIYNGCIPDILILDISMPNGISGYEVSKQLQKDYPSIKIIGLSMLTDCNAVRGMIRCGAKGFLFKDTNPFEIARAIKLVYSGVEYYPSCLNLSPTEIFVYKNTPIDWLENITRTETVTAKLISTDISNSLVADELNISVSAVNKKIKSLFKKTNTSSRIGLLAFLRRVGVLE